MLSNLFEVSDFPNLFCNSYGAVLMKGSWWGAVQKGGKGGKDSGKGGKGDMEGMLMGMMGKMGGKGGTDSWEGDSWKGAFKNGQIQSV